MTGDRDGDDDRDGDGDDDRDGNDPPGVPHDPGDVDDTPTVTCERCGREWDVGRELEDVGNRAFEQFALDHRRHTGHFPDDVETWRADCRQCPETSEHLDQRGATPWAETHARHTRHDVEIHHAHDEGPTLVEADAGQGKEPGPVIRKVVGSTTRRRAVGTVTRYS